MPPAAISGALAASMSAALVGDEAWVGPTDLPYARIQELGGEMHGHPLMKWRRVGNPMRYFAREFELLEPRPYLRPATDDVVDSGRLTEIYVEQWTEAQMEVLG